MPRAGLVLAALLLSVACVPALYPLTAPDASPPIIVQVSDPLDVSAAPIYIAENQGYFKGEGLDVQLVNVSQSEVVQAVATNQLQFGLTLPSPALFNALEGGVPVKIVASAIVNKEADRPAGFLVRKDLIDGGQYRSAADPKGATGAVRAEASRFEVERFRQQGGLTSNDVSFLTITDLAGVLAAFANRSIAGAWSSEPYVTAAELRVSKKRWWARANCCAAPRRRL